MRFAMRARMQKNELDASWTIFLIVPFDIRARNLFMNLRRKQAVELNPRLAEINFHSFRHWRATMLMHQTHRDFYCVKQVLRHKSIKNTAIYLHRESIIFGESGNDEFAVKVTEKPEEVEAMLEVG